MADKLIIEGREYELPDMNSLDLGEARIVKRWTGLTLEKLEKVDPTDVDLICAFVHVVLRRENPNVSMRDVEALKLVEIHSVEDDDEEEPDGPPVEGAASPDTPPSDGGEPSAAAGEPSPETTPPASGDPS